MKALTVCQPFAHLICLPDDDPQAKRVENRKWYTGYRGPLLIHAGMSRDWLELDETGKRDEFYDIPLALMDFGAIIGVCRMRDCVDGRSIPNDDYLLAVKRFPWLASHEHAEKGCFWFVLTEVRRLHLPVPMRGKQGLFDVPPDVAQLVRDQFEDI